MMRVNKQWLATKILYCCLAFPVSVSAEGLDVVFTIDNSLPQGNHIQSTMTVYVSNLSGSDVKNVDLRMEQTNVAMILRSVLQVGRIAAGQAGTAYGDVLIDNNAIDELDSLALRVDYDDANGVHQTQLVSAYMAN